MTRITYPTGTSPPPVLLLNVLTVDSTVNFLFVLNWSLRSPLSGKILLSCRTRFFFFILSVLLYGTLPRIYHFYSNLFYPSSVLYFLEHTIRFLSSFNCPCRLLTVQLYSEHLFNVTLLTFVLYSDELSTTVLRYTLYHCWDSVIFTFIVHKVSYVQLSNPSSLLLLQTQG